MTRPLTAIAAMRQALAMQRDDVATAIDLFQQWTGETACPAERRCLAANIGFGMTSGRAAMRRWEYRLALRLCPDRSIWRRSNRNPATLIGA
jgi:hypothetical protein